MCNTRTAYALALSVAAVGSATLAFIMLCSVTGLAFEDLFVVCQYHSVERTCILWDYRKTNSLLFSAGSFLLAAIFMGVAAGALYRTRPDREVCGRPE